MKIWLGPAGVPTVSQDRSTLGGLKTVAELGLNAMEVEFVRKVYLRPEAAREVGKLAKELGIRLSVHAPYFVNLCSPEADKLEGSKQRIIASAHRAALMGADIVVFHPGYYGKLSPAEALLKMKEACEDLLGAFDQEGIERVKLGLETTGRVTQFGELAEIVQICREIKECVPVIDWAHLFARAAGRIDYSEIFDRLAPLKLGHLHTHFTGVEFTPIGMTGRGNERCHLEMGVNRPPFEPLAREIVKRRIDITLISESPILEQDALVMRRVFERLGYRF
jgi:deoxyribonuclease-4